MIASLYIFYQKKKFLSSRICLRRGGRHLLFRKRNGEILFSGKESMRDDIHTSAIGQKEPDLTDEVGQIYFNRL